MSEELNRAFDVCVKNRNVGENLEFGEAKKKLVDAGVHMSEEQIKRIVAVTNENRTSLDFEKFSKLFSNTENKRAYKEEPAWKLLCAGAVAGAVSRTCTSPLERLKILNQVRGMQTIGANEYKGVVSSFLQMWQLEGTKGFFKGNGTNVIRIAPYSAIQFFSYERYKQLALTDKGGHLSPIQNLIAGGMAGITSLLCTYPLDLIRSRLTIQTTDQKYTGIANTFSTVVREEGYAALYKGLFTSILGVAPYVAINFTTYENLKTHFVEPGHPPSVLQSLGFGALAGATAQTITYPIDLLRRRLQMQGIGGNPRIYSGPWDAVKKIVKNDGVLALYRGMIPCYLKVIPAISISFCCYEVMRYVLGIDSQKITFSTG